MANSAAFGKLDLPAEYNRKPQGILVKNDDSFVTIHRLRAILHVAENPKSLTKFKGFGTKLAQPMANSKTMEDVMESIKQHIWDIYAALIVVGAALLVGGLMLILPQWA